MKIIKSQINRISIPTAGQTIYWDESLPGFGLRATPSRMTYITQGRVGGRTVRVTLGRHGPLTPDMARKEAQKRLGEMAQGIDPNRRARAEKLAGVTLEEAYRAYIACKPLTPNTLRDYERAIRVGFSTWKAMPLPQITGGMVNRRFDEISRDGPAKANQMFRFLRALLGWAMWRYGHDDGTPLLPTNPCEILSKLKRWHRIERRERHIEPGKLAAFMAALAHDADDSAHRRAAKDLCALLVLTGLREQEGCGLRWQDVDLEVKRLTVRHTKNHRIHTLPIGPWLAQRLRLRRMETGLSPFVFPADNSAGHLRNHRRDVLAICRSAGVEFRLHDLRRTFASIVNHHLERSLSVYSIKRLLNHSVAGDVTAGYIQHSVEVLREPMEMVEQFVLRSAGIVPTALLHPLRGADGNASEPPLSVRDLALEYPLTRKSALTA